MSVQGSTPLNFSPLPPGSSQTIPSNSGSPSKTTNMQLAARAALLKKQGFMNNQASFTATATKENNSPTQERTATIASSQLKLAPTKNPQNSAKVTELNILTEKTDSIAALPKPLSWKKFYKVNDAGDEVRQISSPNDLYVNKSKLVTVDGNEMQVPSNIELKPDFKLFDRFGSERETSALNITSISEEEFDKILKRTIERFESKRETVREEPKKLKKDETIQPKKLDTLTSKSTDELLEKIIKKQEKYKEDLHILKKIEEEKILDEISAKKRKQNQEKLR